MYCNCMLFEVTIFVIIFLDEVKVDAPDQPGKGQIIAFTVWGVLRGMETFRDNYDIFSQKLNFGVFLVGELTDWDFMSSEPWRHSGRNATFSQENLIF